MQDWVYFERFLEESFAEGQVSRELRLSHEELNYLEHYHPQWVCTPLGVATGEKGWYWLSLSGI